METVKHGKRAWWIAIIVFFTILRSPMDIDGSVLGFNPTFYVWIVMVISVFSFFIFKSRINIFLRFGFLYALVNCFLSRHPGHSLISFIPVIGAIGFFILMIRGNKKDFDLVLKIYPAVFLLQLMFIIFQLCNLDFIFNPSRQFENIPFGAIGQMMRLASFLACLLPLLCLKKKWFTKLFYVAVTTFIVWQTKSSGGLMAICACVGFYLFMKIRLAIPKRMLRFLISVLIIVSTLTSVVLYLEKDGRFGSFQRKDERPAVWLRAVQVTNVRPIFGNGYQTFGLVFPLNSGDLMSGTKDCPEWDIGGIKGDWQIWGEAHSDPIELYWDFGLIGLFIAFCFVLSLMYIFCRCKKTDEILVLMSGLIGIGVNSFVHFPSKMLCISIPIMTVLLALFVVYSRGIVKPGTFDFDNYNFDYIKKNKKILWVMSIIIAISGYTICATWPESGKIVVGSKRPAKQEVKLDVDEQPESCKIIRMRSR